MIELFDARVLLDIDIDDTHTEIDEQILTSLDWLMDKTELMEKERIAFEEMVQNRISKCETTGMELLGEAIQFYRKNMKLAHFKAANLFLTEARFLFRLIVEEYADFAPQPMIHRAHIRLTKIEELLTLLSEKETDA